MRTLLATSLVASTLVACSLASPTYITSDSTPVDESDSTSTKPSSTTSTSGATTAPTPANGACKTDDYDKPAVASLTACGKGQGHCFDKTKTDHAELFVQDSCADAAQICVPDNILAAGGDKLKSCTVSILSAPGGCVNTDLVPSIGAAGGGALTPDGCDAAQKCVPCNNPGGDKAATGFCNPIGVHKNACTSGSGTTTPPPAPAAPCCTTNGKSNGICIDASQVPPANKDDVKQLDCASGSMCVPAALAGGAPVKCDAGFLGKGVCMDKCFNDMMSMAGGIGILSSDGCGSNTELCIPCSMASMGGTKVPGCE